MADEPGQMTLGELIEAMRVHARNSPDRVVRFDFVHFQPDGFHSYRGYYDQVALGYAWPGHNPDGRDREDVTTGRFLDECKAAAAATFHGWKGGDFQMSEATPVWVARPDESGGTAIVAVRDDGWCLRLITACIDS